MIDDSGRIKIISVRSASRTFSTMRSIEASKQECERALELQEQAYADFQRKLETLIEAVIASGETNIMIEIRPTGP